MSRYRIELRGDHQDLERLRDGFPSGDVSVLAEAGKFYATAQELDAEDDLPKVHQLASERVRELALAAVITTPVAIGAIEILEAGTAPRHVAYLAAAGMTSTSAFAAARLLVDGVEQPALTQEQRRLSVLRSQPHLKTALEIWCGRDRAWPQLYRVLEEVKKVTDPVSSGWCANAEYKRFKHTANSARAGGIDARHADNGLAAPQQPMMLAEAQAFIKRLLDRAIDNQANLASSPPANSGQP